MDIVGKGGVFLDIFVERMEQELKVIAVSKCIGVCIYILLIIRIEIIDGMNFKLDIISFENARYFFTEETFDKRNRIIE